MKEFEETLMKIENYMETSTPGGLPNDEQKVFNQSRTLIKAEMKRYISSEEQFSQMEDDIENLKNLM